MTLSRRKTLALIGGGAIVAAAGGVAFEITRPRDSVAPWERAGQYDDPRMRALSWAILAPNPHNLQPWKVDLSVPVRRALPRSRPAAAADRPVQSPDHRIAGLFPGASAHGGPSGRARRRGGPVPRRRGPGRPRRTPVAICRFGPHRCARSALRPCRHRRSNKEPYDMSRDRSRPRCWPRIASVARHTEVGVTVRRRSRSFAR
jgi:hypothetical protein